MFSKLKNLIFFSKLPATKKKKSEYDKSQSRLGFAGRVRVKREKELEEKKKEDMSLKRRFKSTKVVKKIVTPKKIVRRQDVVVHKLIFKVTRNNIFITVMDPLGRYVFYSSGGLDYFFLRKRTVAVANILLGENLGVELRSKFIHALDLEFHGLPFKSHRLSLIKGLVSSKMFIRDIIDKTPISHNGCDRKKKKRKKFKKRS